MRERVVTELDFRMPEYRHAKPEDYEFRADGKLVRKDRWEQAIHTIRSLVGQGSRREFEIEEVVEAVRCLAVDQEGWTQVADMCDPSDAPSDGCSVDLRLKDASLLRGAIFQRAASLWLWREMDFTELVEAWREAVPLEEAAPE